MYTHRAAATIYEGLEPGYSCFDSGLPATLTRLDGLRLPTAILYLLSLHPTSPVASQMPVTSPHLVCTEEPSRTCSVTAAEDSLCPAPSAPSTVSSPSGERRRRLSRLARDGVRIPRDRRDPPPGSRFRTAFRVKVDDFLVPRNAGCLVCQLRVELLVFGGRALALSCSSLFLLRSSPVLWPVAVSMLLYPALSLFCVAHADTARAEDVDAPSLNTTVASGLWDACVERRRRTLCSVTTELKNPLASLGDAGVETNLRLLDAEGERCETAQLFEVAVCAESTYL